MKWKFIALIILPLGVECQQRPQPIRNDSMLHPDSSRINPYKTISEIALPVGFTRTNTEKDSFGEWLRQLQLKKDKTVYLYNGQPKANQDVQLAVINISTGNKDIQQCADAVMRLRAEYLYANKRFSAISFSDNNKRRYELGTRTDRNHFDEYLEQVFVHCGTLSLSRQLKPIKMNDMKIGDVLIKGGSPGHAMIIVDMAINPAGRKIYMLAQSYMPAQDVHIVKNPAHEGKNAWYELTNSTIYTPEWTFYPDQLKTW
jgi:Domain of unknown function (4846)